MASRRGVRDRTTKKVQYQAPSAAANNSPTAWLAVDWDVPVVASMVA
jgi:hypothetical protein